MSKISDELRNWCDDPYMGKVDDLYSLADRVDAEMVKLPISADGQIWTGREACFWTGATQDDYHTFDSICLSHGKWSVEDTSYRMYEAESVWYERPDSLERIANELDEMVDAADSADDNCEKLADIADRIRKLAKKKENCIDE